jgi:hypothetical protein
MSDLHPDDEALSAHLDGEPAEPRGHVEGCAACTARLEQLRRVRAAIGAPVPPPPAWQRDTAVSRALDAADRRGGSGRRLATWAGGVAAATLLLLGAAFGLSQLSNQGGSNAELTQTGASTTTGRGEAAAATAVAELGDLGALTDTAALRAVVQPTLAQLTADAPTAERATPGAAQQFAAGDSARLGKAARRCVDAARALDPANVRPAAAGRATWQGTPAEVLVYAVDGRPGAARVYVLARTDCRVLEFQSYAP